MTGAQDDGGYDLDPKKLAKGTLAPKGAHEKHHILQVADMKKYLNAVFGAPDVVKFTALRIFSLVILTIKKASLLLKLVDGQMQAGM